MHRSLLRVLVVTGLLLPAFAFAGTPVAVEFKAEDGVEIRWDFYGLKSDEGKSAPMILLFHQAGSNRGEYAEIAPRLNKLGFHALAIDQRSGAKRWGTENETVTRLGESTEYLEALPDLEAALEWKSKSGYGGKTLVLGSSYSAALVFLLAAEHEEIDGVLSFSPGEYLGAPSDQVRNAAKQVTRPVLVLTPEGERDRAGAIVEVLPGDAHRFVVPERAVHGASMLVADRNPGADEIWPVVVEFLEAFLD